MTQSLLKVLMDKVKKNIIEISQTDLIEKINSQQEFLLLDVRSPDVWEKSHLPKAVNCDRGLLEINIEKIEGNQEKEIIIYCGGGTRSALSAETLQRMGYSNVKSLAGGYKAWEKSALPTNKKT